MSKLRNIIKINALKFSNTKFGKIAFSSWRNNSDIYCFHRVLPLNLIERDGNPVNDFTVSTVFFEEFLKFCNDNYQPCTLNDLLSHQYSKNKLCHITFDDGYIDNFKYALPILEKYSVPFTIYATTSLIDGSRDYWWQYVWELAKIRKKNFYDLSNFLRNKSSDFRVQFLNEGLGKDYINSQKRIMLNWSELKELSRHPLATVGSHTLTHPLLKILSDQECYFELSHSKKIIEEFLGVEVEHFAYPYGGRDSFGSREIRFLNDLGYKSAVTTLCSTILNNCYSIPRYLITEKGGISAARARVGGISNLMRNQLLL